MVPSPASNETQKEGSVRSSPLHSGSKDTRTVENANDESDDWELLNMRSANEKRLESKEESGSTAPVTSKEGGQHSQEIDELRCCDSEWVLEHACQDDAEEKEDIAFDESHEEIGQSSYKSILSRSLMACFSEVKSWEMAKSVEAARGDDVQDSVKAPVIIHASLPEIGSKSVLTKDLFQAAPQHNNYGFELKTIHKESKKMTI